MASVAVSVARPRVVPGPVTLLLAGVALLLAAQPVLIVTIARIWAPSTMIQEMFSHAFSTPMLLEHGTHFVPVGHFFALYVALPSFVANDLLADRSLFDRAHAFVVAVYVLHGAILAVLYFIGLKLTPLLHERLALLLVAFGQGWLMRFTNLRLTVNYDLLINVLCLGLALMFVQRARSRGQPGRSTAITLGLIGGVMLGTKYSLLIILGPFMLLALLPRPLTLGAALRQLAWSGLTVVVTAILLMLAYVHFRVESFTTSVLELLAYHSSPLVRQSTPFMIQELQRWLDPDSYYFGLQALITIWAALLIATGLLVRARRVDALLIVAASVFGAALLAYAFNQRRTGGTTLDISMFLLLDVAVLATCWRGEPRRHVVPRVAVGLLSLVAVLATAMLHPLAIVDRLAANSEQARAFEALRHAHPELPIIYYMSGYPQPLTFPSIDIYAHVGLQATPVTAAYVRDVLPRTAFRGPADGLLEGPQLMVIPEYVDTLPESPSDRVEWPDMYPRVATLTEYPAFGGRVASLGLACQVFQFRGEYSSSLHHVWVYPTRVTACPVSENHDGRR